MMKQKKRVLIVSPFLLLPHRIASVRVNGIADALSETCDIEYMGFTPLSHSEKPSRYSKSLSIPLFLSGEPCGHVSSSVARAVQAVLKRVLKKIGRDEWSIWSSLAWRKNAKLIENYDYIVASSPPLSNILLATKLAAKCGAKLVLDFRDVPTLRYLHNYERKVVKSTIANSVCCMTTSGPQALILKKIVPEMRCIVSSGFYVGEVSTQQERNTDALKIIYGGSLYAGKRDLSPLFAALKNVTFQVELHLYLHEVEQDHIRNNFLDDILENKVLLWDLVDRDTFFERAEQADVGLIVVGENDGWVDHENAVPGKYFEYIRAGLVMMALSPHGSAIERELKETEFGVNFDLGATASDIANGLQALQSLKISGNQQTKYAAKNVLKPLLKFINADDS